MSDSAERGTSSSAGRERGSSASGASAGDEVSAGDQVSDSAEASAGDEVSGGDAVNLRRLNLVLLILGILLGVTLALLLTGGSEALSGRTEAELRGEQHAEVRRAAVAEVQAFLGVEHGNVDEQAQTVLDGATGDFKQQYADELEGLRQSATDQQSMAKATVLEVGISDIDPTTATVFVAANTEVTSRSTGGRPRTVPWRIQLDMVKEGERWLTSGLQFVG